MIRSGIRQTSLIKKSISFYQVKERKWRLTILGKSDVVESVLWGWDGADKVNGGQIMKGGGWQEEEFWIVDSNLSQEHVFDHVTLRKNTRVGVDDELKGVKLAGASGGSPNPESSVGLAQSLANFTNGKVQTLHTISAGSYDLCFMVSSCQRFLWSVQAFTV